MDSRFSLLLTFAVMSSTLLAAPSPGKDVLGILRRLVAEVAGNMDALPKRTQDRVHDIRVGMKKFRAALRLAESALGRPTFTKSDKLARSLKNHFGSERDKDVQKELLLDLLDQDEALATAATLGLQGRDPQRETDLAPARETCSALASLVDFFHLENLTGEDLSVAWLDSYRRSRRAMRACHKDTRNDPLFHEWRKGVKTFLYQSAMIGPPPDRFVANADRLASLLGTHHDLSTLTDCLAAHLPGSNAERVALARKKVVARRALVLGARLFSEKPAAVLRKAGLP